MSIFKNKPFIFLLIINVIYIAIQREHHSVYFELKQKVKYVLGEIGLEKYKKIKRIYNTENLVIYFYKANAIQLAPYKGKAIDNVISLNRDSDLVLPPAIYEWGGEFYDMRKEGYYYMVDFKKNLSRNFIIYKQDVESLLSSISWLHVHGNKDDQNSYNENLKKIKTSKLSLTCGYISTFVHKLLAEYNIQSRLITFLTMEEWNTYDNGHTLIEVKIGNEWILYDIDNNRYFEYSNVKMNGKNFLNINIDWDKVRYIPLSNDENLDATDFSNNGISYHGFGDLINNNINEWYKRVMQIPIIIENGVFYVGLPDQRFKERVLEYYPNAKILTRDQFLKHFY